MQVSTAGVAGIGIPTANARPQHPAAAPRGGPPHPTSPLEGEERRRRPRASLPGDSDVGGPTQYFQMRAQIAVALDRRGGLS